MGLKALPCTTRNCRGSKKARGTAALPGGAPYLIGSPPPQWPFRYTCATCKRLTSLSAADYSRLPELKTSALAAMGQLAPVVKDWIGRGLKEREATDMLDAGFRLTDLVRLERNKQG